MITNKGDLKISNDNPKTYTVMEQHGQYCVCKLLGQFEKLEDAIDLQSRITLGIISEEDASKKLFNDIHENDID